MGALVIRRATKDDCHHIRRLIQELAVFEGMESQVEVSEKTLENDGFENAPPFFHSLLATLDNEVIGYALYYYLYSTNEGGEIFYLEDLYMKEEYRGKGHGKQLFMAVVEEAQKRRSACMQWCVLNWNSKAIDFYKSLGAFDLTLSQDIHMYRLTFSVIGRILTEKGTT
ncbi:thialysine N-epsilon-acetyltransferase-like [Watersipora subatra]|uniref:thialysine N-epsilon-acetyltransferase-like n=1 Tax=Watersipora subatra TaxID=2589382 RepID=UPI00355C2DD2